MTGMKYSRAARACSCGFLLQSLAYNKFPGTLYRDQSTIFSNFRVLEKGKGRDDRKSAGSDELLEHGRAVEALAVAVPELVALLLRLMQHALHRVQACQRRAQLSARSA